MASVVAVIALTSCGTVRKSKSRAEITVQATETAISAHKTDSAGVSSKTEATASYETESAQNKVTVYFRPDTSAETVEFSFPDPYTGRDLTNSYPEITPVLIPARLIERVEYTGERSRQRQDSTATTSHQAAHVSTRDTAAHRANTEIKVVEQNKEKAVKNTWSLWLLAGLALAVVLALRLVAGQWPWRLFR